MPGIVKLTTFERDFLERMGRAGGKKKTKKKKAAARINIAKARAAIKSKYPPCLGGYPNGQHHFNPETKQCYSKKCRDAYPDLRWERQRKKPN